ncbi:MAG: sugar phosphate isomerase/epimerase, partial [Elusimicrobiota bacterium]|nr:sugar phosphate isomerase/epimerase [Elusimicrobiota bacterium]
MLDYTKRAVDFSVAVGCENVVFGCPKNRNIPNDINNALDIASNFFSQIAAYAVKNRIVIALEPNPTV